MIVFEDYYRTPAQFIIKYLGLTADNKCGKGCELKKNGIYISYIKKPFQIYWGGTYQEVCLTSMTSLFKKNFNVYVQRAGCFSKLSTIWRIY